MTTDTGTDDPAAAQTDTGGRRHRSAYSRDRSKTVVGQVVAVHTDPPRTIPWRGLEVTTSIFKEAVAGRVCATGTNLCGDGHAALVNHGGTNKAVYAYPREHYPYWRSQLGAMRRALAPSARNLAVCGIDEKHVHDGDLPQIGTVLLRVTEPRYPCFKLGIRLGDDSIVDRFVHANRAGFYMSIAQPGDLAAGDPIRLVESHPSRLRIAELMPDPVVRENLVAEIVASWRKQGFPVDIQHSSEPLSRSSKLPGNFDAATGSRSTHSGAGLALAAMLVTFCLTQRPSSCVGRSA